MSFDPASMLMGVVLGVARYLREGRDKAMEECNARVQSLAEEIKTKSTEKKNLEGKMSVLTKELANAKVTHILFCVDPVVLKSLFHSIPESGAGVGGQLAAAVSA